MRGPNLSEFTPKYTLWFLFSENLTPPHYLLQDFTGVPAVVDLGTPLAMVRQSNPPPSFILNQTRSLSCSLFTDSVCFSLSLSPCHMTAAMRDTCKRLGGDPDKINPLVPVDLVIDHSVQVCTYSSALPVAESKLIVTASSVKVDEYGTNSALEKNLELEMQRNAERFTFLKWGANAFKGLTIIPPGSGIVHQVHAHSFLNRLSE